MVLDVMFVEVGIIFNLFKKCQREWGNILYKFLNIIKFEV